MYRYGRTYAKHLSGVATVPGTLWGRRIKRLAPPTLARARSCVLPGIRDRGAARARLCVHVLWLRGATHTGACCDWIRLTSASRALIAVTATRSGALVIEQRGPRLRS